MVRFFSHGLGYCGGMVAAAYMPQVKGFPDALAEQALDDALASGATVPVLAISGVQGSGKSTLAAQVVARAQARGLNAAALSIDDVYLIRAQRQRQPSNTSRSNWPMSACPKRSGPRWTPRWTCWCSKAGSSARPRRTMPSWTAP